ncbi:MAG TPA: hypothetical protein VH044_00275 [Polyangiaceae bacterium]|nr:hypothetical protein [Polyangiaceae bacterium]
MTLQSLLLRALPLPAPGRVFAESEWRTFVRMAEVLVPDVAEVTPEEVADNVEKFLVIGRSKRAWRVRFLAHLVEWSPVALGQKPLSQMSLDERRRFVEDHYIEGGHIWAICAKIRYLVLMGTYGDGRMHARTSYVPASRRGRLQVVPYKETNGVPRAAAS